MPPDSAAGWHSHHLTNPPGTAGGQQPEITTERDGKGLKGGLTGERLALLSFHHDKFFLSGELSIKIKVSTLRAEPP